MYLKRKGSLVVFLSLVALWFFAAATVVLGTLFWISIAISLLTTTLAAFAFNDVSRPIRALAIAVFVVVLLGVGWLLFGN